MIPAAPDPKQFDQTSLLEGGLLTSGAATDPFVKKRRRPRTYDIAMLRYVGFYRYVLSTHVVYRFFTYAGRGGRYGYKAVSRLLERGFLEATPLTPAKGASSPMVLQVADAGWAFLGRAAPTDGKRVGEELIRNYRLQFAELMLERTVDGWALVPRERTWDALRRWGLAAYKGRMLDHDERLRRDRLERLTKPEKPITLRALRYEPTGTVRLLLPVRRGLSFTRLLRNLPGFLGLLPPLEVELVGDDPRLLAAAQKSLARWAKTHRLTVTPVVAPSFRGRQRAPDRAVVPGESRYTGAGLPDPRALV